jgi:hypothetical protein
VRRQVVFALLYNAGLGLALLAVSLGELVLAAVRLGRKAPKGATLARLGVAVGLVVLFAAGHALVNPWMLDLLRALRGML